jgi:death-on-curing protein
MIIQINREMIIRFGGTYLGTDNLHNGESLDWVLEAIQYPIFDNDQYPTIPMKAAILSWIINEGHVFHDGNKRTSIMCAMLFLETNGYKLLASQKELSDISLLIADNKNNGFSFKDYVAWVEAHCQEL